MKKRIYIDGKAVDLDMIDDGGKYTVTYGPVFLGYVKKKEEANQDSEEKHWQAEDVLGDVRKYKRLKDALLNMCFDCEDFWKESFRRINERNGLRP